MAFTAQGRHLIAGNWVDGPGTFTSTPVTGARHVVQTGSTELADRAARAAEEAFLSYGRSTRAERAAFLEAIAEEIDARGADITAIAMAETGLPEARLNGERGRTTGQLRLFAAHIRDGAYLDRRIDPAIRKRGGIRGWRSASTTWRSPRPRPAPRRRWRCWSTRRSRW